jgi:hypothetical protein
MEPNSTATQNPIGPPDVGRTLVEYIRTQRQNAGIFLAIVSLALFGLAVFLAVKGFRPTTPEKEVDKPLTERPDDLSLADSGKGSEVSSVRKTQYHLGWIASLLGVLGTGASAAWLLVNIPPSCEAEQRTEARSIILIVGGVLGSALILLGLGEFYVWSDSLSNWLDKGETRESRWVLIPLLMIVLGAGLVFLSVQPARAEERNNRPLRLWVYGANLGLGALLLFVVLVVANVVISTRVPNKLDTTAGGFYSMSPNTEEILANLAEPIQVYAILPGSGSRLESDLRDVLTRFQEASKDKFKVEFVSTVTNTARLATLKTDFPPVQTAELGGVVLSFASDKRRFSFIPTEEFFTSPRRARPGEEQEKTTFIGEGRLVKELLFLADNKQKPRVYFTQGAGELQLRGDASPDRMATELSQYLERNYLDVQPLTLDKDNPKVPNDCAVLVIADPQRTIPANHSEAIRKYLTEPLPDNRKGKLLILAGATPPTRTQLKVVPTGLETWLPQFNVSLGDKYLLSLAADRAANPALVPVGFTENAVRSGNPIARTLRRIEFQMLLPREVTTLNTNPQYSALPLLVTASEYGAWVEEQIPGNLSQALARADRAGELRPRVTGVVISEGGVGRLAVIGNGWMASDEVAKAYADVGGPPAFDLIGATMDWLRDRPPIPSGVVAKTYDTFALPNPKTIDRMRLMYLPLGLAMLVIGGLGLGVWVTRRR